MGEFVPLETKELALKLFRQGLRARKISESLGLDRSQVKEWLKSSDRIKITL